MAVTYDNTDLILNRVRFHLQDSKISDAQIIELVKLTIDDIAQQTKIFKKLYGFAIYKELDVYDFNAIVNMQEQMEEELSDVAFETITQEQINDYLSTHQAIDLSPTLDKTQFIEREGQAKFIEVSHIYDEDIRDIGHKFSHRANGIYTVNDQDWLDAHDDKLKVVIASVVPAIDELHEDTISHLITAIIAGVKYYNADAYESQADAQVSNLYYQRFWQKIQDIINSRSNYTVSTKNALHKSMWP